MSHSSSSRNPSHTYPYETNTPPSSPRRQDQQMTTMREALEKLTNVVGRLDRSQAHLFPPDFEVKFPARTRARRPPTKKTLHFSKGESSRSRADEVRIPR